MPTQEQQPHEHAQEGMPQAEQEQRYKTLAVRVEESLHAQLRFVAQLSGNSLSDEIRQAIETRVTTAQDDPDLIARAQQAREEIERDAAARAAAIAGFIGATATATTTSRSRRSTKSSSE